MTDIQGGSARDESPLEWLVTGTTEESRQQEWAVLSLGKSKLISLVVISLVSLVPCDPFTILTISTEKITNKRSFIQTKQHYTLQQKMLQMGIRKSASLHTIRGWMA